MRRICFLTLLGFLLTIAAGRIAWPNSPPGIGVGLFPGWNIDARAAAMGGAYVAVARGASTAYYNPAGLAHLERLDIGGMYSEPYGAGFGVSFQSVSALGPLGTQTASVVPGLGVSVAWIAFTISDIPVWGEEGPGAPFDATSSLYIASVGMPLLGSDDWSGGASLKYYHARILEGRAEGFGLDLGVLGLLPLEAFPLTIGVDATNVGTTTIQWYETSGEPKNYIPWVNRIGATASLMDGKLLLSCQFDWAVGRPADEQGLHLGAEISPVKGLSLRMGWSENLQAAGAVTAGLGVHLFDRFVLDYAYLPGKVFGATHLLSVQFGF